MGVNLRFFSHGKHGNEKEITDFWFPQTYADKNWKCADFSMKLSNQATKQLLIGGTIDPGREGAFAELPFETEEKVGGVSIGKTEEFEEAIGADYEELEAKSKTNGRLFPFIHGEIQITLEVAGFVTATESNLIRSCNLIRSEVDAFHHTEVSVNL